MDQSVIFNSNLTVPVPENPDLVMTEERGREPRQRVRSALELSLRFLAKNVGCLTAAYDERIRTLNNVIAGIAARGPD